MMRPLAVASEAIPPLPRFDGPSVGLIYDSWSVQTPRAATLVTRHRGGDMGEGEGRGFERSEDRMLGHFQDATSFIRCRRDEACVSINAHLSMYLYVYIRVCFAVRKLCHMCDVTYVRTCMYILLST